eukprot:gene22426-28551_t
MTKIKYTDTGAEIYANGKHNSSNIFDGHVLSVDEAKEGMVALLELEQAERLAVIDQLLMLVVTPSRTTATIDLLSAIARHYGLISVEGDKITTVMTQLINASTTVREVGLLLCMSLLKRVGRAIEPFALPLLRTFLMLHGDRSSVVRDLSAAICCTMFQTICPHVFRNVFPVLTAMLVEEDWRIKVGALNVLRIISPRVSLQLSPLLPQLIPLVSECMSDARKPVSIAGTEAMLAACGAISNEDIRHLVPEIVSVIARPEESAKALDHLLETTFVTNVDAPTLALIAPLLTKALRGRSSLLKRKAAKVIDNMCRLVQEPAFVAPFVPMLLPALDKVIDEIVDQEVCGVVQEARAVLLKAMGDGNGTMTPESAILSVANASVTGLDVDATEVALHGALLEAVPALSAAPAVAKFITQVTAQLVVYGTLVNPNFDAAQDAWRNAVAMAVPSEWKDCTVPYLEESEAEHLSHTFRVAALGPVPDMCIDTSGEDGNVCNIEFSLAFGGKILLHNANLRLGKGRRYGLMGKNGAGKTTLLTNIGNGHIEGLPETLRTVYVQHDESTDDMGISTLDEMMQGQDMILAEVSREAAKAALVEIGFTDAMLDASRSALSGGWKMKLLIIKAMLSKANVLLLDEPTNHLDAASVQWLTSYLQKADEVTCLIVSHDTVFLDNVVTDIIHYETRKLVYYHGNLTHFVAIHPEARYYYELEGNTLSFKFPTPERLDGINSVTRTVLKMDHITYTYPGAAKPTLNDCSVKLCLGSRVAVLGANGAGKSTLIKLLVQEMEPDPDTGGEVWKHHNLRVAYVAQHSFHHVEQHLDDTPVDYIKWRFSGGVDKEDLSRPSLKLTEEEEAAHKVQKYGDILTIIGRRKNGRTMEYECTFQGQTKRDLNKYIAIEELVERGYTKLVQQCDTKIAAAAAGLDLRPLLITEIQGHLDDFNLESEFGTHGSIRRLSGGQKVKLVLAAAMWNKPHLIILDEPTNYLDRQALGALTQAIKGYGGGVLIISHNSEFTDALCTERWIVNNGVCVTEGEAEETALKAISTNNVRKSRSANNLPTEAGAQGGGNTNATVVSDELLNPKTLFKLSKKEIRKLEKSANAAGVPLKEYLSKIKMGSPEWGWL